MQISMKAQYIFWDSKLLPIYSLAFVHSIPSWLVQAEIKCTVGVCCSDILIKLIGQDFRIYIREGLCVPYIVMHSFLNFTTLSTFSCELSHQFWTWESNSGPANKVLVNPMVLSKKVPNQNLLNRYFKCNFMKVCDPIVLS